MYVGHDQRSCISDVYTKLREIPVWSTGAPTLLSLLLIGVVQCFALRQSGSTGTLTGFRVVRTAP